MYVYNGHCLIYYCSSTGSGSTKSDEDDGDEDDEEECTIDDEDDDDLQSVSSTEESNHSLLSGKHILHYSIRRTIISMQSGFVGFGKFSYFRGYASSYRCFQY